MTKIRATNDGSHEQHNHANILEYAEPHPTGRTLIAYGQMTSPECRRLAACWNACEGFDTEALEMIGIMGDTMLSRFQARDAVELTLITERLKAIQERDAALAALRLYEAAHESLFTQCCSNPVTNAWGKEVNMSALNDAHQQAQRVLRDRVRQDIARGSRQSNGKLPG